MYYITTKQGDQVRGQFRSKLGLHAVLTIRTFPGHKLIILMVPSNEKIVWGWRMITKLLCSMAFHPVTLSKKLPSQSSKVAFHTEFLCNYLKHFHLGCLWMAVPVNYKIVNATKD